MSVEDTLNQRNTTHGDFDSHAYLSQNLKYIMHKAAKWDDLYFTQKEALDMIQHKIARILNGNSSYKDHWHDIQGYAKLVEDEL